LTEVCADFLRNLEYVGTFRLLVESRIVPMSALLARRNPNARRGQQVTGLTPGKGSAPNVRPTLPMLHVGRFAQTSVMPTDGGLAVADRDGLHGFRAPDATVHPSIAKQDGQALQCLGLVKDFHEHATAATVTDDVAIRE